MKPRLRLTPGLVTDSWELKLTALGLALLLWAAVRSEELTRFTMHDVPVSVRLADDGWITDGAVQPAAVTIDVRGPVRELIRLAFAQATLIVPVEDVEDTLELYRARPEWLELDGRFEGVRVDEIEPSVLRLRFQPIERRAETVAVRLESQLKASTRLAAPPTARPAEVVIEGPRSRVQAIDSVYARVIDVERALREGSIDAEIDTLGTGVTASPAQVVVRIQVAPDSTPSPVSLGEARP